MEFQTKSNQYSGTNFREKKSQDRVERKLFPGRVKEGTDKEGKIE